jgi:hypothetical protein
LLFQNRNTLSALKSRGRIKLPVIIKNSGTPNLPNEKKTKQATFDWVDREVTVSNVIVFSLNGE